MTGDAQALRTLLAGQAETGAVVIHRPGNVPAGLNVHVAEDRGEDNWIVADAGLGERSGRIEVRFYGSGNTLHLGSNEIMAGVMRFHGSHGTTWCQGKGRAPSLFHVTHWSNRTEVRIGPGTTSNGTQLIATGDGARIHVGGDCMFAAATWVMTSDMHCIVDSRTGEVLNKLGNVGDVRIGRHVWVGQDSMVLHGVTIGKGAIIGAKSLVKSDVPETAIVAGTPAKVVRENATWLRSHAFTQHEFDRVRASLELD